MVTKFMKAYQNLRRGQRGITGLETAIILIAFVTVASVLGYTVLSAGIFSAEKGKAAVYQGLSQAQASMEVKGSVIATGDGTTVSNVSFTLASVLNDQDVDMTAPPNNTLVINYSDSEGASATNLDWTATPQGIHSTDSDSMLKPNEQMVMNVVLPPTAAANLKAYDTFTLQIIPVTGSAITIQRTLPGVISGAMDLN